MQLELSGLTPLWILIGGVLSGFMNALASSGSAVTLPLLMFVGLPANVANATNRLGIITGALTSVLVFRREGLLDWKPALKICLWPWLGAVVGAIMATRITNKATELTIFVAVVLAFVLILVGSKRFLRPVTGSPKPLGLVQAVILFAVGIWAGFIVLDSATYLLLALVLGLNVELRQANAYKALSLLGIAVLSVLVFWEHHQLHLGAGALLAVGNVVGAWLGTRCAVLKGSEVWVYRLLVLIISLELLKLGYGFFIN